MFPEFPNAQKRMMDMWSAAVFQGMHGDPLFAGLPVRVQKEGNRAKIGGSETDYIRISAGQTITARVGEGQSVAEFYDNAEAIGKQMGEQQAKHLLTKMSEPSSVAQPIDITEATTFDDLLALWEKMDLRFKQDVPQWPQIFAGDYGIELVKSLIAGAYEDPVSREKWRLLIARKKKEFDEREARRRLVD